MNWTMEVSDLLKIISMIAGCIYTIIRIEVTTAKLTLAIEHLAGAVKKIDGAVEDNNDETMELKERVAVVESKLERLEHCRT